MKALVYAGPKRVEVQEVKEPEKQDGKVKLNIRYCGVCGSDIGIYLGTHPRAKAPLILGHEFLGIVAEDGKKFKKGDRVVLIRYFPVDTVLHAEVEMNMYVIHWD